MGLGYRIVETTSYRSTLRERLKIREQWIKDYLIYKKHKDITDRVKKETQSKVPLVPTLLKIYFLPTIIWNFFCDFEGWYNYNKCTLEIQIIKDELNKKEGHYYYGKFIPGPKKNE
jgi:hypothetical protein